MLVLRRHQHSGVPYFVSLILLALLAASIPTFQATPLTTQVTVVMEASRANDKNVTSTKVAENRDDIERRRLQLFPIGIPSLGGDGSNNATCPPGCPLCQCNSTDDAACLMSKSVEACASDSIDECFAGMLPPDFNVGGLCAVQCGDDASLATEGDPLFSNSEVCRVCDIYACCDECPSERASECFPPAAAAADGHTPVGWQPADCSGGAVASSSLAVAVLFTVFSLVV